MAFHFAFSLLGYNKPEFFVPDPDWWWEKRWFVFRICGFGVKKLELIFRYKAHGYDKMKGYEFCKDF